MGFAKHNRFQKRIPAVKPDDFLSSTARFVTFACLTITAIPSAANDAMKINGALSSQSAQSMKQPSATHVNAATMAAPKNPALPTHTATPMKPPATINKPPFANDGQKATTVAPGLLGSAITGLGDDARGIVAGESLVIQGRGFGASAGRVDIAVQTSSSAQQELSFRVSQWSDSEIRGRVGASSGIGDGKASIVIYPSGRSVADAISSSQSGIAGATRNGWRFRFVATRAEQTLAFNGLGASLTHSYAQPTPQLLEHGTGLMRGHAVSRRMQAAALGCAVPPPVDKYRVALANGFELIRVAANDLNAQVRHGLAKPESCDVRGTVPSANFLRVATDGSFVVSPGWDTINRFGAKSRIDGCDSSRYIGVTKTPLGFDWDDTRGFDRCAANSEYVIDHLVVRGPAGVNPLTGVATNGAAIK